MTKGADDDLGGIMALRRLRVLVGAFGLALVTGVGLVSPAAAGNITPIQPLDPSASHSPVKAPSAAPTTGRVPFRGWTAKRIKDVAVSDARNARSVHVKGSGVGQDERLSWDGVFTKTAGKLRMVSNKQGTIDVIRIGNRLFIAGDEKAWTNWGATSDQAAAAAGKWVEVVGKSANADKVRSFVTLNQWTGLLSGMRPTKRVAGKKIGGKATVGVFEPGNPGTVLYVNTSGRAYPVMAEALDKSTVVYYSEWNRNVRIAVPPVAAKVPA
jgi:hypothetical protein